MKRTPLKQGKGFNKGNTPLKRGGVIKSHKKLGNISSKKKVRDGEKKKAYNSIDDSRDHKCEGCGSWTRPLSHSHLISVGYNSKLEAAERNIRLHCLSFDGTKGCHEKWEDGILPEIEEMLDFKENMDIIRELDESFFKRKYVSIYGSAPQESN